MEIQKLNYPGNDFDLCFLYGIVALLLLENKILPGKKLDNEIYSCIMVAKSED